MGIGLEFLRQGPLCWKVDVIRRFWRKARIYGKARSASIAICNSWKARGMRWSKIWRPVSSVQKLHLKRQSVTVQHCVGIAKSWNRPTLIWCNAAGTQVCPASPSPEFHYPGSHCPSTNYSIDSKFHLSWLWRRKFPGRKIASRSSISCFTQNIVHVSWSDLIVPDVYVTMWRTSWTY